jgi:hypothetical protein
VISEQLARKIGEVLLNHTACEEPMGLCGCPLVPYGDRKDLFIEYGEVFMED